MILLLLCFFITGVFPMKPKEIYVKAGDLVVLHCGECKHDGTLMVWTKETDQKMHLDSNMSASEQQQLGLVVYQNSLVILSASVNHQGNYSCGPLGNTSSKMWFMLTVCPKQSEECNIRNRYNQRCYSGQSCTLHCPEGFIVAAEIPRMKSYEPKWYKESGELSEHYFPRVSLKESGIYICTRSFLYSGQTYNTSHAVVLDVQKGEDIPNLGIGSPKDGQVFEVELGTEVEIACKALTGSCDDSLFWTRDEEFLDNWDYYKDPCNGSEGTSGWITTTLVFREVSQANLSKNYTCKFESDKLTQFVNIVLSKKAQPSYMMLTICTVSIAVLMVVTIVIYVKYKIDITLFLRDKVGFKVCQSNNPDGKSFDAFLMNYKSVTDGGLSEEDRKYLASTLEDQFGYSLCLYDRDVLPGQAVAEAVLDCIDESRAVILVPSFPDPELGSEVLSAIHASLVEKKTRLIFINTEQMEASTSGSFPEALQLLSKAGNSVTWKGGPPSSSFWKQLRYHLLAPQQAPKMQLLSQQC
ncbi:interleukin-1 receptor type 1 [Fundulus heteroclitus]|uniref:interleukin-1 receptor type 1 n=1 Tax=Fundulus heteroclitus TaxID=8078 RepID=UPI00165A9D03|nr:interleukin-1 receptor type 1 [Fundulus heteroclitus]